VRTPVYGWLYASFPPMQSLRAAARFGNLFLLAVAILAAVGCAALRHTSSRRRLTGPATLAAVLLVNIEALRAPIDYQRFEGIPRIYHLLASEPGPVVLAETDWDRWLDTAFSDAETLSGLLKPYAAGELEAWQVSRQVNAPKNQGPALIERAG